MPHRFLTGLRLFWRKRYGVMPLRASLPRLSEWFKTPLGALLMEHEKAMVDDQLRNLFGYHLLQLSVTDHIDLTTASRISHRFALHPQPSAHEHVSALTDFNHLPLPSQSIDVVVLHHILDYSQSPHHVLREAAEVLISSGHLVVVGFNPWSLFGMGRWLARFVTRNPQWRHQSLRLGRVLDWLAVLDFEPVAIKQSFYFLPLQSTRGFKYLQWWERWGKKLQLPWGGVYVIVARKDHLAMRPIKMEWRGYSGLRGWGVTKILGRAGRETKPSARQHPDV